MTCRLTVKQTSDNCIVDQGVFKTEADALAHVKKLWSSEYDWAIKDSELYTTHYYYGAFDYNDL